MSEYTPYTDRYKERNKDIFSKRNSNEISRIKRAEEQSEKGNLWASEEIGTEINKKAEPVKKTLANPMENKSNSRKSRKLEISIIILAYLIVLGISAYFIIVSFFPDIIPGANTYTISAEESKIFNSLSSFYIEDSGVLGEKTEINGETARPIISAKKFNLVFAPKSNIKESDAVLSLDFIFREQETSDIYLEDKLIFPNPDNYEIIKETPTDYIYVKKDALNDINKESLAQSDSTEQFILDNFAGTSIWAIKEIKSNSQLTDYSNQETAINGTFRDSLNLAVYAEGSLNIDFIKQDLNMYVGQDEYTIVITDSNNNVIYNKTFEDDGINTKGNMGEEQNFLINLPGLEKGVYYISFIKDEYNDASDSTIKSIKINSNKILIIGNFLPWSENFQFYTKTNLPKQIGFYYWWDGKEQAIKVNGTIAKDINLTTEINSVRYNEDIIKGEYSFNLEKGYLWVYNDYASINRENWFDLISSSEEFDSQNMIILPKTNFDLINNRFRYEKQVSLNDKTTKLSLRALEANIVNIREIKLSL